MSPAFLLLQYYDFHSSHSSYKNARICMNYAEGLHFSAFHYFTKEIIQFYLVKSLQFRVLVCPETLVCNPILDSSHFLDTTRNIAIPDIDNIKPA